VTWVAHDIRDEVVDFVSHWTERAELSRQRLLGCIELSPRKYRRWQERYGKANEHNAKVPRDHWLEDWENSPSPSLPANIRWKAIAGWPS
jgi:putative transposase